MPMNGFGLTGLASTGATLTDTYDGFGAHFALESVQYPSRQASGLHDPRIAILEINAARLDDVFEARGDEMQRIVAVKLDLEGHEAPALRGAERIFARTKPLLMIEEANRNPEVVKVMTGYGYFHCERHNGCLVAHSEISMMNDGFWVHPEKISEYRRLGIFKGDAP
ncbi:MAG: hypothetical protein C0519_05515 [Hyphomicrobium sp.]|nr:hypothetical protein [Hyphomicrobium sp.]PPD07618.1 MAG: hypothetical protein CTY28_09095 [Hyphomicrobium sp.]